MLMILYFVCLYVNFDVTYRQTYTFLSLLSSSSYYSQTLWDFKDVHTVILLDWNLKARVLSFLPSSIGRDS
jgi:hypothetical protein